MMIVISAKWAHYHTWAPQCPPAAPGGVYPPLNLMRRRKNRGGYTPPTPKILDAAAAGGVTPPRLMRRRWGGLTPPTRLMLRSNPSVGPYGPMCGPGPGAGAGPGPFAVCCTPQKDRLLEKITYNIF